MLGMGPRLSGHPTRQMAIELLAIDRGPCPECGDGVSHGPDLGQDGLVRCKFGCLKCGRKEETVVPFDDWWREAVQEFPQEPVNPHHEIGALPAERKKIFRNDPCPCGSGKKFKKCCLWKDNPRITKE